MRVFVEISGLISGLVNCRVYKYTDFQYELTFRFSRFCNGTILSKYLKISIYLSIKTQIASTFSHKKTNKILHFDKHSNIFKQSLLKCHELSYTLTELNTA